MTTLRSSGSMAIILLLLAGCGPGTQDGPDPQAGEPWRHLEPGLDLGEFASPRPSSAGDSIIRVLRIDAEHFELRLLNSSAPGQGAPLSAKKWCERNGLVAAINASMYQEDYRRSVSLMRSRTHINNPRLSKDKTVLAFDRLDEGVPPVQIIDREYQNFDDLSERYGVLVQSIRMVSARGENVWSQQPRKWSTAAIGMDTSGRVLFIHVRSPYSTHDLIDVLLGLPIDLENAMYAEGGPEAQLYVRSGDFEAEMVGSYESGFMEHDDNDSAWPVPNVIGVARLRRTDD